MPVLKNIGMLATCRNEGGQVDIHPIEDAAMVWKDNTVTWTGPESELPEDHGEAIIHNAGGNLVVPGLVDCHTHLAFGDWRKEEFRMRLQGKSYLEIAKAGGGILSTVQETRKASEEELFNKALGFLQQMSNLGVSAVECKSGYGLTTDQELKLLGVYRRLQREQPVRIVPTFMGAHTIPPEYESDRQGYIDLLVNEMIPAVAGEKLAEFCDVFVEDTAFTVDEARKILNAAKSAGLKPKIHADQLTTCGGAELAAEVHAVSADHLEQVSDEGIEKMADAGVIGVALPLASLYTRQEPLNCRRLVERDVKVAVATDFNPGSAPSYHLPLAMMLACNRGGLTPNEALKGATIYAAEAIGRADELGSLEPGKKADFAIIEVPDPTYWMYHFGGNQCLVTFINGN